MEKARKPTHVELLKRHFELTQKRAHNLMQCDQWYSERLYGLLLGMEFAVKCLNATHHHEANAVRSLEYVNGWLDKIDGKHQSKLYCDILYKRNF